MTKGRGTQTIDGENCPELLLYTYSILPTPSSMFVLELTVTMATVTPTTSLLNSRHWSRKWCVTINFPSVVVFGLQCQAYDYQPMSSFNSVH